MAGMLEDVSFRSGEITLAGHLRRPTDRRPPYPALGFTGPFTGVKEQVTGTYAAAPRSPWLPHACLRPPQLRGQRRWTRQHEDTGGKLADLCDATSFLATHPDVDEQRIGCVGHP
jgi:uncharacterized protein